MFNTCKLPPRPGEGPSGLHLRLGVLLLQLVIIVVATISACGNIVHASASGAAATSTSTTTASASHGYHRGIIQAGKTRTPSRRRFSPSKVSFSLRDSESDTATVTSSDIASLTAFQDALPIPDKIDMTSAKGGSDPDLTMGVHKIKWKFHRWLPSTYVYAFGRTARKASVPGPTIVAATNVTITVSWSNSITDTSHLLTVDTTLGAPDISTNGVPFVPHLHGGHSHSTSDGHPDAWFTASAKTGSAYSSSLYTYYNIQPAATLWYHDHTVGLTRLNVAAGLYAAYVLTDSATESKFNLPSGNYDIPLIFQDQSFYSNGTMYQDTKGSALHPYWVPESLGDYETVNGKVNPYLNVHRRKYLFRLINANSARFLSLSFNYSLNLSPSTTHLLNVTQVMSDAGYLSAPITLSSLLLLPGGRVGIVVDFSSLPVGTRVYLKNDASSPYPNGQSPPTNVATIMKFRVIPRIRRDKSTIPTSLATIPTADATLASNYPRGYDISLTETMGSSGPEQFLLEGKMWTDAVTINVAYGTSQVWNLINTGGSAHPMHVHFVPHRIISRRPFDAMAYTKGQCTFSDDSCYTGALESPGDNEKGWMDTTYATPYYVTKILLDFTVNNYGKGKVFDPSTGPGYVIHCHILGHEDNDMMRPVKVT